MDSATSKIAFAIAMIALFAFNHFVYDLSVEGPVQVQLSELRRQCITILLEMTKLLFSLATALFGLIGVFVLQTTKDHRLLSPSSRRDAVLAFSLAAVSIDFGYIYMEKWAEVLGKDLFVPFVNLLTIPQTGQFVAFLLALFFGARLALRELPNMVDKGGRNDEA